MTYGPDSAFAIPSVGGEPHEAEFGLTKREYFAAKAMQGLLAEEDKTRYVEWAEVAESSVLLADALIRALNRPDLQELAAE